MWSFDLSQYESVWKLVIQFSILLVALIIGNTLRRLIPFLSKAFIPSALIGGLLLFLLNTFIYVVFKIDLVDERIMQIITYHALGFGFVAMSLKIINKDENSKTKAISIFQNGALTGATYMLQAVLGIGVSLLFFAFGGELFYDAGILLPLGFGQGPGNALTWDLNFSSRGFFDGYGSVGLTIASVGFIVASIIGVIYINIFKRKGEIKVVDAKLERTIRDFETEDEIEDSESVDKASIQIAFIFAAYLLAFGIMYFFAKVSDWTGVLLFNNVAWGFNFIWGVITATLIKLVIKLLRKKRIMKRNYINNYQMDRISGFCFDMMIIAGVAAIDIDVVSKYAWFIIIICLVGALATVVYVRIITNLCYKDFAHEAFLVNFGTLTGTASNGMILLREVDPTFKTEASNIFILSQFPAMLFVAPLLLLLTMSSESLLGCFISLGIFLVLFIGYTVFLVVSAKMQNKKRVK